MSRVGPGNAIYAVELAIATFFLEGCTPNTNKNEEKK
jgi:hypothetical protein